ncbi:hypothetical protein D9757_002715 [Collybiopsis confluens]|uniref:Uncharacterized protein n=1 Tax=Collybiopsis confluens TaxID=2823264 RepID=A0A8H5ME40_9AGAR|nr:hypothetical protein D9757_002715 [Collybiopsis confluens]
MVANYFSLDASSSISAQAQTAHALSPGALKGQFEQPNNERRPGEKYTIFHSRDLFGTVPEEYEKLVKRGSDLIGVPEDYINGLVEKFERRKLWKK